MENLDEESRNEIKLGAREISIGLVGKFITRAKSLGISRKDLAKNLGISQQCLHELKSGLLGLDLELIGLFEEVLHVDIDIKGVERPMEELEDGSWVEMTEKVSELPQAEIPVKFEKVEQSSEEKPKEGFVKTFQYDVKGEYYGNYEE